MLLRSAPHAAMVMTTAPSIMGSICCSQKRPYTLRRHMPRGAGAPRVPAAPPHHLLQLFLLCSTQPRELLLNTSVHYSAHRPNSTRPGTHPETELCAPLLHLLQRGGYARCCTCCLLACCCCAAVAAPAAAAAYEAASAAFLRAAASIFLRDLAVMPCFLVPSRV
jgi:hypothetical protein